MSPHFSWPQYHQPWDLTIELLEPKTTREAVTDRGSRRIRLDLAGEWAEAGFGFQLATTEKAPAGVGPVEAYVLVSSSRSHTRIPVRLKASGAAFVGEARISRRLLAGVVEVTGEIISGGGTTHLVGVSDSWRVVIDPAEAPPAPGAPPFKIVPLSFSADDAPTQLQSATQSYALMELSGPEPILYLNRDVTGLEVILSSPRPKLERRRLRDLLAGQIAHYALGALLREALAQADVDGDEVTLPDDRLLRQVCEVISEQVASVEDAEEMVRRISGSPTDRAMLWMEIDDAMNSLTNLAEAVARATGEVFYA